MKSAGDQNCVTILRNRDKLRASGVVLEREMNYQRQLFILGLVLMGTFADRPVEHDLTGEYQRCLRRDSPWVLIC